MHAKLLTVVLVMVYHYMCSVMLKRFVRGEEQHGHVWYRWFNEAPVILMLIIVCLVVVKPF
jgi:putative membrane protein